MLTIRHFYDVYIKVAESIVCCTSVGTTALYVDKCYVVASDFYDTGSMAKDAKTIFLLCLCVVV